MSSTDLTSPPPKRRPQASPGRWPDPAGALAEAPEVPWQRLYSSLAAGGFKQGQHVTIVGPTGTGKTHIALALADIRYDRGGAVLLLACKPDDPLIDDAIRSGYYLIPGNDLARGIEYVDGKPVHRRVIYWPRLSERARKAIPHRVILDVEREHQKPLVASALGYVRNLKRWCLVIDEGTWCYRDLALGPQIDSAFTQFRTLKASIIILAQRPAWTGRYSLSQADHVILFQTAHTEDLKALGDISGMDTRLVQQIVRHLDHKKHEFLYLNVRERLMLRSVAPPR